MADHSKPTITSTYSNFVSEMDARFDDLAVGLDPAVISATNVPTGTIRWSSASNKWQKYSGTAWNDLTATYAISISGNAGTVTNGVYTNGSYANPSWITSLAGSKISGAIPGNAATATKLAAAVNINNVAFDGSAAINVNTVNTVTFNNSGTGDSSGTTFNGGTARTISHNTIGAVSLTGSYANPTWITSLASSKLTGQVAVANGGTGASTQSGALQNLGAIAAQAVAKTGAYTVVAADRGDVILCSGTFTVSLTAAATLGNGFSVGVINTGTGTITVDPNSTENIDGGLTKVLTPGQSCIIITDGTSWRTLGLSGGGATGGGADQIFYENGQTVTTNYTISTDKNAMTAGPVTIQNGVTVTIPDNSTWVIV
jgi:hypothetical protein